MLEHKNQIYLSRIIRQILLNLFSVALIQRLLHDLLTGASPPTAMREPRLHIILITQSLSYVDSTSNTAWFKNYRASKFVECPCNFLHNYVIICFMIIKLWILTCQKRSLQVAPHILSKFVTSRVNFVDT